MTIKQLMAGLALVAAGSAQAVTVLSEGFENVGALSGAGWVFTNNSATPLGLNWFQGNVGNFTADAGPPDSYAAANFASTAAISGAVSNWMLTPVVSLDSTSIISFAVRTSGEGFLDTLELRLSTNGASSNVGSTATSVGDFTVLLGSYSNSFTPAGWTMLSVAYSGPDITGRIGFRYVIDDVAVNGNYLGVDTLTVTAVPEPAGYVLMGLGIAGLLLRRRLAA